MREKVKPKSTEKKSWHKTFGYNFICFVRLFRLPVFRRKTQTRNLSVELYCISVNISKKAPIQETESQFKGYDAIENRAKSFLIAVSVVFGLSELGSRD